MNTEEFELLFPIEVQNAFKSTIDAFEKEEQPMREVNLKEFKKYEYYWNTLQNYFWDDTARDYRPYEEGILKYGNDLGLNNEDVGRQIKATMMKTPVKFCGFEPSET